MVKKNNPLVFPFIKYISPTWYLNLCPIGNITFFVDYDKLSEKDKFNITYDNKYNSEKISKIDAAYQAFQLGIIKPIEYQLIINELEIELLDNYRFVKKYYHPFWVFYIFFIRIISFKNPANELVCLLKTFKIKKKPIDKITIYNDYFEKYDSNLILCNKKITIIIPTLNRYDYLKDVLLDFTKQTYTNFKLIIIDQSDYFNSDFYTKFPLDIKIIRQNEKALWLARNTGVQNSDTDIIAFSEDDVRIPNNWLENHLKCLDYYQCDISNGVFYPIGSEIPAHRKVFKYSEQFATGNTCMYKSVFHKTGLFDRQFEKMRAGDGEFGLRCYLNGIKSISNPLAFCEDVKAPTGGLREMGSWDAFRPKKLLAPRPIPSVLYMTRKYFGNQAAILSCIINVPPSIIPYKYKKNKLIPFFGIVISILIFPLIVYTIFKSWFISSRMLKEGPKIDVLNNLVLND
jgi:glycosyltransferase involved in cell wall biosynthesis